MFLSKSVVKSYLPIIRTVVLAAVCFAGRALAEEAVADKDTLCASDVKATLVVKDTKAAKQKGPWNLEALQRVPQAAWGATSGLVQEVYYEGELFNGKPTRVFAYHAVAAVLRGHALLASRKEVDAQRVAVTGISWGGYLTCIVAGLDDQLKAAVPVYGCGYIYENSVWVEPRFSKMADLQRQRWVENFDPSRYVGSSKCPILFLTGMRDFAYPPDSLQKTYNLVKTPLTLSVQPDRKHGHHWSFPEVDAFIDSQLKGGQPLLKLGAMQTTNGTVSSQVTSPLSVSKAELNYTTDIGPWQKRQWKTTPAMISSNIVTATLTVEVPLAYYLYVTDQRGLAVSTPHVELKAGEVD